MEPKSFVDGRDGCEPAPRTTDYILCGWRVRSSVVLPEVMPWAGDSRPPDITIRLGAAPPVADPIWRTARGLVQIGRDGACRMVSADIACFHIAHGREVVVEPYADPDTIELRAWLLGPVLGTLCHQRSLFPLHASCVRIGGSAVALTGRPGAGKSTLATALVRRGHGLVADDVCVIDSTRSDGPTVLPSFPRLKLWEDAMQSLGIPAEGTARARSDRAKFHFCQPGSFGSSPLKLRAIYVLDRSLTADSDGIRPEHGASAADALAREIFRPGIGFHLGDKAALLNAALRIASAVPVFRMPLRPDLPRIDATAARAEAHFVSFTTEARETIASAVG
jgi:hypothetical protein